MWVSQCHTLSLPGGLVEAVRAKLVRVVHDLGARLDPLHMSIGEGEVAAIGVTRFRRSTHWDRPGGLRDA